MIAFFAILIGLGIIIEIISLKRNFSKVSVNFEVSAYCTEPGTPFNIKTTVSNRSYVPISHIALSDTYSRHATLPENLTVLRRKHGIHIKKICAVGGRRRKKLILQTSIEKRGVHPFSADSIEFGDFLGFKEFKENLFLNHDVVVYPKRAESAALKEALSKFCGDMAAKRFLIRDPILTIGTREYTGAEPMKEMHWLKSAASGQLMVKEFDFNREFSVRVLMSVDGITAQDDEEMDRICSTSRTICETLTEQGASVDFFSNAMRRGAPRSDSWQCEVSAVHKGGLLEGLGRATNLHSGSLNDLVSLATKENSLDCAYILIVPSGETLAHSAIQKLSDSTTQEVMLIQMESNI